MGRCLLVVLGVLVAGVVVCSAQDSSLRRWGGTTTGLSRRLSSRGAYDSYYGAPMMPGPRDGYYQMMQKRPRPRAKPKPTRAPFKFNFDVDLVSLINYLLLPLLPLLLTLGNRGTSSTTTVTATGGGTGTGTDTVLDYDTGETVNSINSNTDSVTENNSQVITESVDNSPVTTEVNEEINDDNDVITNP